MDTKALEYFSLVNPLARKIIHDEKLLQDAVGDEWNKMDWRKQEELIDNFMVDISVRENYANLEKSSSYPSSFPNLKLETGEKIIVDFENDVSIYIKVFPVWIPILPCSLILRICQSCASKYFSQSNMDPDFNFFLMSFFLFLARIRFL